MAWGYDADGSFQCDVCGGTGSIVCPNHVTADLVWGACPNCDNDGSSGCAHCGGGDGDLAEGELVFAVPPEWYEDPIVAGAIRYWDGCQWLGPPRWLDEE